MRISQTPQTLMSFLVLLSHTDYVKAIPTRKEILEQLGYGYIEERNVPCGEGNAYTCTGAQACYTNYALSSAYCSVPNVVETWGSGGYTVYTTTYTETDLVLRTSTTTSWYQAASTWAATPTSTLVTETVSPILCDTSLEQTSCGPTLCCASWQICDGQNMCIPNPSSSLSYVVSTVAATSSGSPPDRVTGVSTFTPTTTLTSTATTFKSTGTFLPAATASGSTLPVVSSSTSHGLSAGAIAGIVIGTIAGIIILLLICFCCIVKAGFDGLLALFGLGSRRNRRSRERVEVVEERYSRHGSGTASRRDTHTGWFGAGGRPATVTETRKKKSGGFGGLGAVGAGLLGLAVVLGLKRRHDKKEMRERSDIGSSYYTDSFTGTSESSASSDRRTRQSRHSRR